MTTIDTASTDTPTKAPSPRSLKVNWFGAFWRWHFYGALLVIPVLFVLAVTGMTYLFRAQIDSAMHPGVITVAVPDGAERLPLSAQQQAVTAEFPDRSVVSLFDGLGDRSTVFVTELTDGTTQNVYVDPYRAEVTGSLTDDQLISDVFIRIHGNLLAGEFGDRLIELGASWAIVLTITGFLIFFLGRRPRQLAAQKKLKGARLRSAHALVGLPVGLGILMLVTSGLPWTGLWGSVSEEVASTGGSSLWGSDPGAESTMKDVIEETDGSNAPPGWAVGMGPTGQSEGSGARVSIDAAVSAAEAEGAPSPYYVIYPVDAAGVFSVMSSQWYQQGNAAESDVTLEQTVHVDQYSGEAVAQYGYEDYSPLAQVVSNGIAIHEGRRYGPINTILTSLFCLAVIFMCISAPIMWWRRRGTASGIAAPRARLPLFGSISLLIGVVALGIFLPMFGLSVLVILAVDQLLIRRIPAWRKFFNTV
ncbi:PepSY domain-containing protein [Microbacterium sp. LMC-P-041]|uniref:PepSY-associated TM helix domain-containing protein n=1 Tax=Microbacterium sp. LMC-P-041 TaxID=3040293 RepID=UPI002553C0DF|nr:PepSY domain-containing protein [Microbacterium sp. LMC-P-041]